MGVEAATGDFEAVTGGQALLELFGERDAAAQDAEQQRVARWGQHGGGGICHGIQHGVELGGVVEAETLAGGGA